MMALVLSLLLAIGSPLIGGRATWYDAPSSHDAAAGPLLREALGSHWRGQWVRVCGNGVDPVWNLHRCVTVQLSDWCLCSKGRRLIDLDPEWKNPAYLTSLRGWTPRQLSNLERVRQTVVTKK
jgi:hypothetical protein